MGGQGGLCPPVHHDQIESCAYGSSDELASQAGVEPDASHSTRDLHRWKAEQRGRASMQKCS